MGIMVNRTSHKNNKTYNLLELCNTLFVYVMLYPFISQRFAYLFVEEIVVLINK